MTAEQGTPTAPHSLPPDESLSANRLGIAGVVFFVVAAAAPLVGMTGAVPVAIVLGNGAAAPGAYLAAGLVLLVFSVGYSSLSSRVSNTGAFFAFVGRGLGIVPGVGSAFVSLLAYLAIQLSIFGFFGATAASLFASDVGLDLSWWAWALIAWAIVLLLSILQVDIGAKVLGVLMLVEVCSLGLVAVVVLFQGGGPDGLGFWDSFSPSKIFAGGFGGSAGIALAFAFASYIGFEATAIYAEETKNPKRSVPIATYTAVCVIALLFATTSWAVVSGIGSDHVVDRVAEVSSLDGTPLADPAAVLFSVADEYVGHWLSVLMSWLVLSSLFAGLLAFQNSASRYFFSMGRARVLPRALDRVNHRAAPIIGAVTTSVITFLVIVYFAATGKDPVLNLFYWFSGTAVLSIVLVEVLVSLAVIVYFRRTHEDTRVWNTLIAPIVAILGLASAAYLIVARFGLLAGTVASAEESMNAFALSATGWVLVLLPFIVFIVGVAVGAARQNRGDSAEAMADLVS
ncbi:MAG: APC family permease [Nocardioides sp.]|uniref:APC family permease n=1 Tax=Nocardioides sp. TaxID=35761 RepID=UPI0039E5411F